MKPKQLAIRLLSFVPTLFLLSLIFGFSAQSGEESGSLSFQISLFLVQLISPFLPASTSEALLYERAEMIHFFVRKAAHMSEYFLLALSLQLPLAAWFSQRFTRKARILAGFLLTVAFAALDEFHQTFVPGRSGNFTDVCIDSTGAALASLLLLLIFMVHQKKRKKLSINLET